MNKMIENFDNAINLMWDVLPFLRKNKETKQFEKAKELLSCLRSERLALLKKLDGRLL